VVLAAEVETPRVLDADEASAAVRTEAEVDVAVVVAAVPMAPRQRPLRRKSN
jgi:hypothetical protein